MIKEHPMANQADNKASGIRTVRVESARLGATLASTPNSPASERSAFALRLFKDAKERSEAISGRKGKVLAQ